MRIGATVIGLIFLVIAAGFVILGIESWLPGSLMFAIRFVFLISGILLAVLGAVLLWLGRHRRAE
jgi:vacuolar-type H+-ATPase subunit I/STV1